MNAQEGCLFKEDYRDGRRDQHRSGELHGKVRVYRQETGGRAVDGKLLKNSRGKRGFWLIRPSRILAEGRPGEQTSPRG